ncbi:response regulator [Sulfurimonas sp.]|nr:response regulator [Sulfurimonas sp.]
MELVNQYFIEIISAISIVTLLLIYLLFRKPSNTIKPIHEEKEPDKEELLVEDSAPVQELHVEEKKPLEKIATPTRPAQINRVKREVVPHGKIVKDSFKDFTGMRILVAEDNHINQKVITALLADSGIEVIVVNDGQECLDTLKTDTNFTLILMDAHMPILDGFQATRNIRKEHSLNHIPIVALSGDTAVDDIQNMMNVGMEAHLEKPLKMDALYDIFYIYTSEEGLNQATESKSLEPETSSLNFNIEKGLSTCGNDKDFFDEILDDFIAKYGESADILTNDLNSNNSLHAARQLLDISGVAANIGAYNLYKASLELKNSIKSPDDLEYINILKDFKRALISTLDEIKTYQAK